MSRWLDSATRQELQQARAAADPSPPAGRVSVSTDDLVIGAQWTSFDNGLTWDRTPSPERCLARGATHLTVVAVNYDRGEVVAKIDLSAVFGVAAVKP